MTSDMPNGRGSSRCRVCLKEHKLPVCLYHYILPLAKSPRRSLHLGGCPQCTSASLRSRHGDLQRCPGKSGTATSNFLSSSSNGGHSTIAGAGDGMIVENHRRGFGQWRLDWKTGLSWVAWLQATMACFVDLLMSSDCQVDGISLSSFG